MKILSIGNSFSQDAQRYLHRLAKKEGVELKTVNLFIGGCPLRKHYLNMLDDNVAYSFQFNGESTGIQVSLRQLLVSDEWDVITLQQASGLSWNYESYQPYLSELVKYVRKYCPHSKIYIHETWAYENGSERLEKLGYHSSREMYEDIKKSYKKAIEEIQADGLIPSGRAMLRAGETGIEKVHRDTYHASLGAGRYLLALTWYKTLTGNEIAANDFDELDEEITEAERAIVINAAEWAVKSVEE